jgi:hypothetical protein
MNTDSCLVASRAAYRRLASSHATSLLTRECGEAHEEGGRGVGADEHGERDREHRAGAAQGVLLFRGAEARRRRVAS